jgi:heptosyltransferase II
MSNCHRVLLISPNWVGDAVMAQVVLQGLAQHCESISATLMLDVLSPVSCLDVWRRMDGIREVMTETFQHGVLDLKKRWRWARRCVGKYDQAIVLPNSLKSALIPWLAGIPKRTGYTGELRYGMLNDRRDLDPLMLPRWVDRCYGLSVDRKKRSLAFSETVPVPRLEKSNAEATLLRYRLETIWGQQPNLVLCPGAEFGSAKQWPLHHWVSLSRQCQQQGFQVWVLGGPKDQKAGEVIAQEVLGVHTLCGQTSLGEAMDLISIADVVVANDSGLLHVAAAYGIPSVGLYGSTPSVYAPPLARWPGQTQIMELEMACRPCRQRVCPLGHRRCLDDISPDRVGAAIQTALQNKHLGTTNLSIV